MSGATPEADGTGSNRRVMRGALALFSIQPLTWAASLLSVIYLPQFLGSVALGQLAILNALGGSLTMAFGLGMPTVLVRRIAAEPESAPRLSAAALVLSCAVAGIGGGLLVAIVRALHLIDVPRLTLEVAVIGGLTATLQGLILAVLNGQHRLGQFAGLSAGIALATAAGSVGVLAIGGGLLGMLLVIQAVMLIGCYIAWRSLRISLDWSGVSWSSLKALAIAGLPFAGMSMVLRLRGDSEVMLLGIGLSVEVLGWWSAAERISYIALFVPTLLATPLLPALSSVANDLDAFRHTLRRSLDLTVVLTLGASAGIAAVAPAVPRTLGWGNDFASAVPYIELLSLVTPLVSVGIVLGTGLIALGDERRWFIVSVTASSLHLIVTPAAIYVFNTLWEAGGIGAASAKLLIEVLMLCGALYLLPRGSVTLASGVVAVKACIASAIMVVAVRAVLTDDAWYTLPLSIGVGGVVFLVALAALQIVPRSEVADTVEYVRQTIRRKRG